MVQHYEHDAVVLSYSHLREFPRADEALHTLQKIASLVKPIMRARGWRVGQLSEFYPNQPNLLGLNVNRGEKIHLRLRYAGDRSQFLPVEQVTDTMLHELSHIVHGPHDAAFHSLWNQLRDEHEGLLMKGYTGEGFLSKGHRLGGRRVPMHEARRMARAAAEKREKLDKLRRGSGQRLGGRPPQRGEDMRQVITNAVEARNNVGRSRSRDRVQSSRRINSGCGNTLHSDTEIREISDTATRNGFRTQAEEDAANEAAIAQALWELVQEDEARKYGSSYVPPNPTNPTGGTSVGGVGGGGDGDGDSDNGGEGASSSGVPPPVPEWSRPSGAPVKSTPAPDPDASLSADGWTCQTCTLRNPHAYLACDACGGQRPSASKPQQQSKRKMNDVDLSHASIVSFRNSRSSVLDETPAAPTGPAFWMCSRCGNAMERQWWTCSQCGNVKESSK